MNEPLKQENDRLRAYIAKLESAGPATDLIERLTKERDRALRILESSGGLVESVGAGQIVKWLDERAKEVEIVKAERDALRAEVERMRPIVEAYEAWELARATDPTAADAFIEALANLDEAIEKAREKS